MDDVTVIVATYGGSEWIKLARRAVKSAELQAPTYHVHASTLHDARNDGLRLVATEWVVFLDADDELEPGYIERMQAGSADLRAPSVRYVEGGLTRHWMPRVAGHRHECSGECLPFGNWLVVGTMARTRMLLDVGGWEDWPIYEDWALWLRCWQAGASVEAIPDAVYRAHVRQDSRNRAPSMDVKNAVHHEIVAAVLA